MQDCWNSEPGLRPTFTELSEKICEVLTEGSKEYLQLDGAINDDYNDNQPDIIPPSFKTLPRNFRIRSTDDDDTSEANLSSQTKHHETLHHKLLRQMTVSNPGYTYNNTYNSSTSSPDNQIEMVHLKHSNAEA